MSFKNKAKHLLGRWPLPFALAYNALPDKTTNKDLLFNKSTEIVIEGFPRTGNTFAVVFFQMAQKRQIHVAHHLHVECQLIYAAKHDIPGIALIREPEACIRSLLVRERDTTVSSALRRYVRFYSSLLPYHDKLLIVPFDRVVQDMATVIGDCNRKYGADFDCGVHDDMTKKRVFDEISAINDRISSGMATHVSRPIDGRHEFATNISFSNNKGQLDSANELYTRLVSRGGGAL